MKNPINKRVKRDIRASFGKYFALFLLISASTALFSAYFLSQSSIENTYYNSHQVGNVEDGNFVLYNKLSEADVKQIEEVDVKLAEGFFKEIELGSSTLRVYQNNRTSINKPILWQGRLVDNTRDNEIVINKIYAKSNNIKLNDEIKIGDDNYQVVGIVSYPDYSTMVKKRNDLLMNNDKFAVVLVSPISFDKLNSSINYCYFYKNLSELTDKEQMDKIKTIISKVYFAGYGVHDAVIKPLNSNITYMMNDMEADIPKMIEIFVLIMVILALMFTVLAKSTIEHEAGIIGTLIALGYKKNELVRHYMRTPIIVTFVASIAGNIFAYFVLTDIYFDVYYTSYSLPPVIIKVNWIAFIGTTLFPIILVLIINYFSLRRKLKLAPTKFLRRDFKKKNRKPIKLPNFKFIIRFRIRVLVKNRGSYLVMFLGILLANILLLFGLSINPLFTKHSEAMTKAMEYEYKYLLNEPMAKFSDDDKRFSFKSLETASPYDDSDYTIEVYGVETNNVKFQKYAGDTADGVVTSEGLLKKINKKVGDTITLTDRYFGKEYEVKVVAIDENIKSLAMYIERVKLNKLLGLDKDYFNGVYANQRIDISEEKIMTIISRADMKNITEQMLEISSKITFILILISVLIYVVVIYILTKNIIEKAEKSISYLKVFGYTKTEVSKVYLRLSFMAIILFSVICLPIETYAFDKLLFYSLVKYDSYMSPFIPFNAYLATFLLGLGTYLVVRFSQLKMVAKINPVATLKDFIG